MKKFAVLLVLVFSFVLIFSVTQAQEDATLDFSDHTLVLGVAEILTDPDSGEAGRVVWFQNDLGNGQLTHDFVPNDPRNAFFWNSQNGTAPGQISLAVKEGNTSSDVNLNNQVAWFYDSFYTWTNQTCSGLTLNAFAGNSGTPGLVEYFFQTGIIDVGLLQADVTQVGFRGTEFFAPGTSTLGVAYTLFWVDGNGNLTDIDGNGKIDAAMREIYYNDQYEWADNGVEGRQADGSRVFDFPTVAIHEAGHGLSAAHFGNIGVQDGALKAEPRAIMNAIYGGTLRDLTGRDNGSHCSNWDLWPNQ